MIFKGMSTCQFLKNTVVDTTATRPHILQKLHRNQRLVMSQTAECVQMFSKSHRSPLSTEYTRDGVTLSLTLNPETVGAIATTFPSQAVASTAGRVFSHRKTRISSSSSH
jgi:hypothetical protein